MKPSRFFMIIAILLSGVLLSACIDVSQEIVIDRDGSGKFFLDVGFSWALSVLATDNNFGSIDVMKEDYANNPYVNNFEIKETSREGFRHFIIDVDVSDMAGFLREWQKEMGNESIDITLEKLANGNWLFTQAVYLGGSSDSPSSSGGDFSNVIIGTMLANKYWNLKLSVPNVQSTNGEWDKETNTVEWNIPMEKIFNERVELVAEFRDLPIWINYLPWVIAICGLLILSFIGLGLIILVITKRNRYYPLQNFEQN
jgi:hypothetical protein